MSAETDFVVIGSGGGGGTIAWMLARQGYRVVVLEQGSDITTEYQNKPRGPKDPDGFNSSAHSERTFRLQRPDPKRRLRGDYSTFRRTEKDVAKPFANGWTASVLGGGSTIWGTWSYRPQPIDFKLDTFFKDQQWQAKLRMEGYSIPDWPIAFGEMLPYFRVAEALMGVSGNRNAMNTAIQASPWYAAFGANYGAPAEWFDGDYPYPCEAYPITPVGEFVWRGMEYAGMHPVPLPCAIVRPGSGPYQAQQHIDAALAQWGSSAQPEFWKREEGDPLWLQAQREACNLCGFCGEYVCWGMDQAPKFGTRVTTLREIREKAEIRCNTKAIEIMTDGACTRATGVRYLNLENPDSPRVEEIHAAQVIVSCGAVQSARLLRLSGRPDKGLGNGKDLLGRYASFHLFGLGAKITLAPEFQGLLHSEFGPTGNVTSFEPYFLQDAVTQQWVKCGTMTSTAKKNPLEGCVGYFDKPKAPDDIAPLKEMDKSARTLELRMTADDLPMSRNRVDLDPRHVDEYGIPVARITRDLGPNEWRMYGLAWPQLQRAIDRYAKADKQIIESSDITPANVELVGDHQMGTCRMGTDDGNSVVDPNCKLHEMANVYVVDSSFMPTGFGLNPMLTVVANALRVGSWIIKQERQGRC